MAVLLHLLDFDRASTSEKFLEHRKHLNGLEAPRNSLDLQLESSHCPYTQDESIPFSVQLRRNSSSATPTKPWVGREPPKRHKAKQSAPGVVARLMGVDEFPSEVKPSSCEGSRGSSRTRIKKEQIFSKKFNHRKEDEPFSRSKQDPFHPKTSSNLARPFLNMHPQEQQLQKFKKEFEAWHSSRIWESSRGCGLDSRHGSPSDYRSLAQERLNREKLTRYTEAKRNETNEKPPEIGYHISSRSGTDVQGDDFLQGNNRMFQQKKLESAPMQHVNRNSHFDQAPSKRCNEQDITSLPAKIVLLKPGPERFDYLDKGDSASEGKIKEDEGSVSDFLEQVKERLIILGLTSSTAEDVERPNTHNICHFGKSMSPKEVVQQTAAKESDCAMRGTGSIQSESSKSQGSDLQAVEGSIEHFLEEVKERLILVRKGNEDKGFKRPGRQVKSSSLDGSIAKDISQQRATQLEGNVASNMSQLQSRSMLSQTRNAQNGTPCSPKFINRDTQKMLAAASHPGIPMTEESGKRKSICNREEICFSDTRKDLNHQKERKHTDELAATSFLHDLLNSKMVFDHDLVTSGSATKSTLAPKNGMALGKLPTEDHPIFAGADIHSNHEVADDRALETRKRKKHRFSLKWKASTLKDSLTFRNKLFGKKIQSAKRGMDEFGSTSGLVALPSFSRNLSMQENSAEVPPTPASPSSDNQDDTCCERAYHYSPVSTLDVVPFSDDVPVQEAFQETSSNQQVEVPELNRQMHRITFERSAAVKPSAKEGDAKPEGNPEAYLRDVLAAAGFFEDMDGILSIWDSPAAPIRSWVFDEVEEAHREQIQDTRGIEIEHKLLFDLLNEALASELGHFSTNIAPGRSIISSSVVVPSIERLLSDVCGAVYKCIQSPATGEDTINGLVEKVLKQNQWPGIIQGDVELIGRQLEKVVLKELIEEVVVDLLQQSQ